MIRVVLDTNVVVSAYLNPDGLPFLVLKLALVGAVKLCVSDAILAEYAELLARKPFALDRRRARLFLQKIRSAAILFPTGGTLRVTKDPDDNIFLECAEAAKARYLVTGNTRHFPMTWKYTHVVTPPSFINVWKDYQPGADPSS